jgi:hypothetical protein
MMLRKIGKFVLSFIVSIFLSWGIFQYYLTFYAGPGLLLGKMGAFICEDNSKNCNFTSGVDITPCIAGQMSRSQDTTSHDLLRMMQKYKMAIKVLSKTKTEARLELQTQWPILHQAETTIKIAS